MKSDIWKERLGIVLAILLIGLTVFAFTVIAFYPNYSLSHMYRKDGLAATGTFFGGILSPILSLLTIIYVVGTSQNQIKASQKSASESSLFNWIELFRSIRNEIFTIDADEVPLRGISAMNVN